MDALERFNSLVVKLQSTSGRIEKENILKEYSNDDEVKQIIYFIYNTYITTGISKKKLNKIPELDVISNNISYNIMDLLSYLKDHNTGKDSDLQFVSKYLHNRSTYSDLIKSIVSKELKLGVQPITLNKVFGARYIPTFDLMLAESYFTDPDRYLPENVEFDITTKLDGVRCISIFEKGKVKFFSRQGQPFEGLNQLEFAVEENLSPGYVYDGELLLINDNNLSSKDLYRATVKVTNKDGIKENLIFHIFDRIKIEDFQNGISYEHSKNRKDAIHDEICNCKSPYLKEVEILYRGFDKKQIHYWLDKITSQGGEGVMLNLCETPYECKRSRNILKVKKMKTMDLLCVGMEEGAGVNQGRLGALKVEFPAPDGNIYIVDVGGGFKQEERIEFFNNPELVVGKIIEVQYFEVTQNEKGGYSLRFPIFKYIREDKNEPSVY